MLEIGKIKNHSSEIIKSLQKRGIDVTDDLSELLNLNQKRITNQQKLDLILTDSNQIAQHIGQLAKEQKFSTIDKLKTKASTLKEESKKLIQKAKDLESNIRELLISIPNTPHNEVPSGNSEKDNIIVFEWGDLKKSESLFAHWELAEKYNIIDFKQGAKITGSGFPIYIGKGARLQRGLINFFLDYNIKAGYKEYSPPFFVNENSAFNTGQIPDKEGMMYHIVNDNLYAIPTAEIPITNMFSNHKFKADDLPIKCTAYSPCFRREAGSYGKEVRGLNRLHQFDKVEIVEICQPEESYQILDKMVEHVSELLKKLELKFRIVKLCGGDLGFTSALTYDFEVYAPAQKKWLEVSSVSNFETFQSNRLNLKVVNKDKPNSLCHTLNGSSLALPRIIAAILEQNQKKEKIILPDVLSKYLGFYEITI
tara:strand:+ start:274 stop:1545 length:1272 start_codon:yes stop_codon:yes gene_type:complete